MKSKEQLYKVLLFFVAIVWGLGFPFASLALANGYSPINVIFFRFLVSSVLLTLIFYRNLINIKKISLIGAPLIGIIIFSGFYFQITGQTLTTIANTAFITQLNIVLIPIIWSIIKKERIRFKTIITTLVALLGLYFLSIFGTNMDGLHPGDILVFVGAILISFRIIFGSLFQGKYHSDPINLTMVSAYTITIIAGVLTFIEGDLPTITLINFWPLIFLGVVNSAFGYLVQIQALDHVKPETMSLILSFESVIGAVSSIFILGQTLTFNVVIGGSLILAAIIYSNIKIRSIRERRRFFKNLKED